MVRYEDLAQLWGEENICRLSTETLEGIDLPDRAQLVLTQVGLPMELEDLFETDLCRPDRGSIPTAMPRQQGLWYRIGSDYGMDICVEVESGVVRAIDPSGEYPSRFVNANLESFIAFLYLFDRFSKTFGDRIDVDRIGVDRIDEEVYAAFVVMKRELRGIDSKAFESPENWWAMIFEEWEYELS